MKRKFYKCIYPDSQAYYNLDRLLSHNADVYICMSIRNLGKSYSARKLVKHAMERGEDCAWLRWSMSERDVAVRAFAEDSKVKIQRSQHYNVKTVVGEKAKCHFLSVKAAASARDFGVPDMRWCVYDECVPEFYDIKTRRETEFDKLMSLFTTLKRDGNAKLILICNCLDWFNPFFVAWSITPFEPGVIQLIEHGVTIEDNIYKQRIAVENVKPTQAMVKRIASLEVLRGDKRYIGDYLSNAMRKDYKLIETCPRDVPLANIQIRIKNNIYTYRRINDMFYFCKARRRDVPCECPDIADMAPGEGRNPFIGRQLESMLNRGLLRFENGAVYNDMMTAIAKYRMRM